MAFKINNEDVKQIFLYSKNFGTLDNRIEISTLKNGDADDAIVWEKPSEIIDDEITEEINNGR